MGYEATLKHIVDDIIYGAVSVPRLGHGSGFYRRSGKRVADILVTLLALPLLLPAIALFWTLVRLQGGPGFYSQDRVGKDGRTFKCWKLRSMIPDADKVLAEICEADPEIAREWRDNQKLRNDPRITPIGRFLRVTSLDELPQFWNVLCGDMSLVGPRPFMKSQEAIYRAAGGVAYYKMRPAITGPWQVNARGTASFVDRVKFDNDYWRQSSMLTDFKIMFQTFAVVLKCRGQ